MPERTDAMNGLDIPPEMLARAKERRGREHPFADLDPMHTALVVVDMQNAFMDDAVGHAVCPMAREIVPNVNRLAAAVRSGGGGVFWIKISGCGAIGRRRRVLDQEHIQRSVGQGMVGAGRDGHTRTARETSGRDERGDQRA